MKRTQIFVALAFLAVAGLGYLVAVRSTSGKRDKPAAPQAKPSGASKPGGSAFVERAGFKDELPSPTELFERHLEAIGGRNVVADIRNMEVKGSMIVEEANLKLTHWKTLPNMSRWEMARDGFAVTGGFDGNVAWVDYGRGSVPNFEVTPEQARREADPHSEMKYSEYFRDFKTLSVGEIEGRTAYKVSVVNLDGVEELHYFDAEEGFRIAEEKEEKTEWGTKFTRSLYSDFEEFDDLTVATTEKLITKETFQAWQDERYSYRDPPPSQEQTFSFKVESVRFNIDDFPKIEAPENVVLAMGARDVGGTVLLDGEPKAGVKVALKSDFRTPRKNETETDAEGKFLFEDVRGTSYSIEAKYPLANAEVQGSLPTDDEVYNVVIELVSKAGVRGKVTDSSGGAIAGASISHMTYSNDSGEFELLCRERSGRFIRDEKDGPPKCSVIVNAKGYLTFCKTIEVKKGEWTSLDVTLYRAASISGVVRNESGEPMAEVRLRAEPKASKVDEQEERFDERRFFDECREWLNSGASYAATDDNGAFELADILAGDYELSVLSQGDQPAVDVRAPKSDVEIVVRGSGGVSGKVIDAEGKPVPKAYVAVVSKRDGKNIGDDTTGGSLRRTQITKDDGRFAFKSLPTDNYTITARSLDFNGSEDEISEDFSIGGRREVDLVLKLAPKEPTMTISGRVLSPDGKPAWGVAIFARKTATRESWNETRRAFGHGQSDLSGSFKIDNLTKGQYRLTYEYKGLHQKEEIVARAGDDDVLIILPISLTMSGWILGENRKPVTSFFLAGMIESAVSDAAGHFEETAEAGEKGELVIRAEGFRTKALKLGDLRGRERVDLGEIVLEKGRRLTGYVLSSAEETPVKGAVLRCGRAAAMSDSKGFFELENIPEKGAEIRVSAEDFAEAVKPVPDSEREIKLYLNQGATVRARALEMDGNVIEEARVCFSCDPRISFCVDPESGERKGAPEGDCVATAHVYRGEEEPPLFEKKAVKIPASGVVNVDVHEIGDPAILVFSFVDEEGKNIEGFPTLVEGSVPIPQSFQEMATSMLKGAYHPTRSSDDRQKFTFKVAKGAYTLFLRIDSDMEMLMYRQEVQAQAGKTLEKIVRITWDDLAKIELSEDSLREYY